MLSLDGFGVVDEGRRSDTTRIDSLPNNMGCGWYVWACINGRNSGPVVDSALG